MTDDEIKNMPISELERITKHHELHTNWNRISKEYYRRISIKPWYVKPFGIVLLTVIATLIATYIVYKLGWNEPKESKPPMMEKSKTATPSSNIPNKTPLAPPMQKK